MLDKLHDQTTVGRLERLRRDMQRLCQLNPWGWEEGSCEYEDQYETEKEIGSIPVDSLMGEWTRQRHGLDGEVDSWAYVCSKITAEQRLAVQYGWRRLSLYQLEQLEEVALEAMCESYNRSRPDHPKRPGLREMMIDSLSYTLPNWPGPRFGRCAGKVTENWGETEKEITDALLAWMHFALDMQDPLDRALSKQPCDDIGEFPEDDTDGLVPPMLFSSVCEQYRRTGDVLPPAIPGMRLPLFWTWKRRALWIQNLSPENRELLERDHGDLPPQDVHRINTLADTLRPKDCVADVRELVLYALPASDIAIDEPVEDRVRCLACGALACGAGNNDAS